MLHINLTLIKQFKRDAKGRFTKQYREASVRMKLIVMSTIIFVIGVIVVEEYKDLTRPVEAFKEEVEEVPTKPKEVRIEVVYDWSEEKIVEEIRNTFVETPNTAVAVARCESGLDIDVIGPTSDYGLMQIHAPTWHDVAIELGYTDYKTNPIENLQMARYIYEQSGWNAWVCYKNGWWENYL